MNRIMSHYSTKQFTMVELDAISREYKNNVIFHDHFSQSFKPVITLGEANSIIFYLDGVNPGQCITAFTGHDGLRFKMQFTDMSKEDLKQRNFDLAFASVVVDAFFDEKINLAKLADSFEIQSDEDLNLAFWINQALHRPVSA